MNRSLLQVLQSHAQLGDYVMFHPLSQHGISLGEIRHATKTVVELIVFWCLDTTIIRQFLIMPIGATSNRFAAQSGLVEVNKTYEAVSIERSRIKDTYCTSQHPQRANKQGRKGSGPAAGGGWTHVGPDWQPGGDAATVLNSDNTSTIKVLNDY